MRIPRKYKRKDIPKLRYGIIHSQFGYADGVSIVMKQIDQVMQKYLEIPEKNIVYLAGRSKTSGPNIVVRPELWIKDSTNMLMLNHFQDGYGGNRNERIERAISRAEMIIKEFVNKRKIDVIIAHNTSFPVNFIMSIALHRYFRHSLIARKKTPKYILWWHDSHLERKKFKSPTNDVEQYLLHGVPGRYVEYIIFINRLQFKDAQKYLMKLDKIKPGYCESIKSNHTIIYNTTNTFIDSYDDLASDKMKDRIETFLDDFRIRQLLKQKKLGLSQTLFCLQHTRIVNRKRIDFALRYCFALLDRKRRKGHHTKALYFLVSGHSADKSKKKLIKLHKQLSDKYKNDQLFLVFAEDYDNRTDIKFEEYPVIIAKLRGFATYFSEIEGFGNNLLELLASGLIPVVYTYPVFIHDIAKYKFKLIALDKFEITDEDLDKTIDIIRNNRKRKIWINQNLKILRRRFSHNIISFKLARAIIRKRLHP